MSSVAYEIPNFYMGNLSAGVDLSVESAGQYVALDVGAGPVAVLPAAGGPAMGICQNNPVLGEAATIMVQGVSKARLSGTVLAGDLLMCDAAGKLKDATVGNFAIAKALQAGVAGDIVAVLLKNYGKV